MIKDLTSWPSLHIRFSRVTQFFSIFLQRLELCSVLELGPILIHKRSMNTEKVGHDRPASGKSK